MYLCKATRLQTVGWNRKSGNDLLDLLMHDFLRIIVCHSFWTLSDGSGGSKLNNRVPGGGALPIHLVRHLYCLHCLQFNVVTVLIVICCGMCNKRTMMIAV